MSLIRRYCRSCKNVAEHVVEREHEGIERGIFALFSLGMTELANDYYYTCTHCEHKTKKTAL
jgi:ribosomal protein L44E